MRTRTLLSLLLLLAASCAWAQTAAPTGRSYALLVGGMAAQDPYGQWYGDWIFRFQNHLEKTAGVPHDHITRLSGEAATSEAVLGALKAIGPRLLPGDQFILFLVGHGEISQEPTLTLPGPDLSASQLAKALNTLPCKQQIVLNFSASSGDFLKALAAPGRINIAATSPTESNEPVFAEFFLRGLESGRAAAAPGAPGINLLDAFNWAARETPLWIARWEHPSPNTWKADGKETLEIFKKLYHNVPSRQLSPDSNGNVADPIVAVQPPQGQPSKEWWTRRIVTEHAQLEDCGQQIGVPLLTEKGLQPIVAQKPNDPGSLAGRTFLGKPAPLTP